MASEINKWFSERNTLYFMPYNVTQLTHPEAYLHFLVSIFMYVNKISGGRGEGGREGGKH